MRPEFGTMVFWHGSKTWRFGYVSDAGGRLIRMGSWNGDTVSGPVVDPAEIEWRKYR